MDRPRLTAYLTDPDCPVGIVPAPRRREWMDATGDRFAYRCLPLTIANEHGWLLLNPDPCTITWDGGDDLEAISIEHRGTGAWAGSHFGSGIVTWQIPVLFRTEPGWQLLVRGPANLPKDAIAPLEGIVETDWSPATFTVNWKMTRERRVVRFERDEPIAMIVPVQLGALDDFAPEIRPMADAGELEDEHARWRAERGAFLRDLRDGSAGREWQGDYVRGRIGGQVAPRHRKRLSLRSFRRAGD